MAHLSTKYQIGILAIFLVFTPFESYGESCKLSVEEELILKQGKMDQRINYIERMLQNALEEIADNHKDIENLEAEYGTLMEFTNLLTNMSQNRVFFEAYRSGHCFNGMTPSEYDGTLAVTVHGKTCQRWDLQYPHEHNMKDADAYPDETVAGAENYCRDPDNSGFAWCYTTNPDSRWEPCDVTRCMTEFDAGECYHFGERASAYTGDINVTVTGNTCQRWASQYPHQHNFDTDSMYPDGDIYSARNYCRDPEDWGRPWCYTTDSETRWEICDVAKCAE